MGEGCFLTAVSTLELQGWTGKGMGRAPPPPAQGAVSAQEVRAVWECPRAQESPGWLAVRGFILPKGKIPSRLGAVSEGLGFGGALLLPSARAKSPPAESQHPSGRPS